MNKKRRDNFNGWCIITQHVNTNLQMFFLSPPWPTFDSICLSLCGLQPPDQTVVILLRSQGLE